MTRGAEGPRIRGSWYDSKNKRADGSVGRAPRVYAGEIAGSSPVQPATLKHVCIVRCDLPRGVLAAQLIHAAGESAPGSLPSGTHAVALGAEDESSLEKLERRLIKLGVPHHAIREPDSPWCGALMAIGVVPMAQNKNLRKATGSLRLLK